MKQIKVNTELVNKVAEKYGVTPEQYITDSVSVSSGHRVCAHYVEQDGNESIFRIDL